MELETNIRYTRYSFDILTLKNYSFIKFIVIKR